MADLAQNLFLRELAKRDLDKQRAREDERYHSESLGKALNTAETARDAEFDRHLSTAKLAGEHAARLQKDRPEYEAGAIDEASLTGFEGGQASLREAEDKAVRARANTEFEKKLEAANELLKSERDTKSKMSVQGMLDKRAEADRLSREKEGGLDRGAALTRAKEHNAILWAQLNKAKEERAAKQASGLTNTDIPSSIRAKESNIAKESGIAQFRMGEMKENLRNPETGEVDASKVLTPWRQGAAEFGAFESRNLPTTSSYGLKAQMTRQKAFNSAVSYYNTKEFHELIGAAMTDPERKMLADAFAGKDSDPVTFMQLMVEAEKRVKIASVAAQTILTEGRTPGTPEYEQALQEKMANYAAQSEVEEKQKQQAYIKNAGIKKKGIESKVKSYVEATRFVSGDRAAGPADLSVQGRLDAVMRGDVPPEQIGITEQEAVDYALLTGQDLTPLEKLFGAGFAVDRKLNDWFSGLGFGTVGRAAGGAIGAAAGGPMGAAAGSMAGGALLGD